MNKTDYKGDATGSGTSPNLWGDCPLVEMIADSNVGYQWHDEFLHFPTIATTNVKDPYYFFADAGITCLGSTAALGGALTIVQDGSHDNDEGWLQYGTHVYSPFMISDTAGSDKKLWFEARVKVSSIVDDVLAMFVGLAEVGVCAAEYKTDDTGVLADKDYIGFDTLHVNSGTAGTNALVNVVYNLSGQTAKTLITTAHTLVANTHVNLGFVYDPDEETAKRIKFYVDNVEQSTYVTATQIATATGVAFPDAQYMAPTVGTKLGSAVAGTLTMPWWRIAQLR